MVHLHLQDIRGAWLSLLSTAPAAADPGPPGRAQDTGVSVVCGPQPAPESDKRPDDTEPGAPGGAEGDGAAAPGSRGEACSLAAHRTARPSGTAGFSIT